MEPLWGTGWRRAAFGVALIAVIAVAGAACAPAGPTSNESSAVPAEIEARLDAIDEAVAGWRAADDLTTAQRNAEAARNLIVGPDGPGYGDADGDGTVSGAGDIGLLPGLDGEPGLADPPLNDCVERDVLGGDWSDPQARWDEIDVVLAEWAPGNNTMPRLASHPQRVVGWATLTLDTDSPEDAREYAGHAKLHADITRSAYADCPE